MAYYGADLARVHHLGFGNHAEGCAPGILALLAPVKADGGLVVELGCGSGALTGHLLAAGHRVLATDASPAMIELARENLPAANPQVLAMPDDPIPSAAAIVSVGHALSYLEDEASLHRALVAAAQALEPGGVLAVDICDLEWGRARAEAQPFARYEEDWALITRFSLPRPDRFVREMAVFTKNPDGSWRRDDERHDNVLVETSSLPRLLAEHGVVAEIRDAFGAEQLPTGLKVLVGRKA